MSNKMTPAEKAYYEKLDMPKLGVKKSSKERDALVYEREKNMKLKVKYTERQTQDWVKAI